MNSSLPKDYFGEFVFEVSESLQGQRLDTLVLEFLEAEQTPEDSPLAAFSLSRSRILQWIKAGAVSINEVTVFKASLQPKFGDSICVKVPRLEEIHLEADPSVKFDVLLEDEELLVINKPPGLVVHPGAGVNSGTLVNGLLAKVGERCRLPGDLPRPGIVHRLDKDTSGLMVVAKTERAYASLQQQFLPPRQIKRTYLALCTRVPNPITGQLSGEIDAPIGRHPVNRKKMTVNEGKGKAALTRWRVAEDLSHGVLIELELETGRTHQIRVHLLHVNAPILGDPLYGNAFSPLPPRVKTELTFVRRQMLHAQRLCFRHPSKGELVEVVADLPPDMLKAKEALNGT